MKRLICIVLGLFLFMGTGTAWGHDVSFDNLQIDWIGDAAYSTVEHLDDLNNNQIEDGEEAWKGWLSVSVMNTSGVAWGDFHFQMLGGLPGWGIYNDSAEFDDYGNPFSSSQSGFTYDISVDGKSVDFYFYGDTVGIGETATFTVYTDNTAGSLFGVGMYPTPAPVPGAVWLLGSALVGVLGFKRRK